MSDTFSSIWAKSVAPPVVSADMSILPLVAHDPRQRPVLLGDFLNDHVQVGRLGAGMLHHGVGDSASERALLLLRAPGPHLYGHNWHALTSLIRLLRAGWPRSARGCRPIGCLPPSAALGCQGRAP